jgi:hypothetical protein
MHHSEQLRTRLVELRDDALDRMARRGSVEPGQLPLLSGIAAALQALPGAGVAGRAEVYDGGEAIVLRVSDGMVTTSIEVVPGAAIKLAGRLLDAAGLRLAGRIE